MSEIKALQKQVQSLRSENEDLQEQLRILRKEVLDLLRYRERGLGELESQPTRG